jgi:UDP-3-O-[3-hydroxymyristoyl] glucosamine N-acyltransferase
VDRGKFSSTVLGDGCKIDNLVQIDTTVSSVVLHYGRTLAGSVTLGDGVIGGSASIKIMPPGSGAIVGFWSCVPAPAKKHRVILLLKRVMP